MESDVALRKNIRSNEAFFGRYSYNMIPDKNTRRFARVLIPNKQQERKRPSEIRLRRKMPTATLTDSDAVIAKKPQRSGVFTGISIR